MEQRAKQLKQIQQQIPGKLKAIAKGATLRAIEKAAELTPPTDDDLSGTHTRTGTLKDHWNTDSVKEPEIQGDTYVTQLNNNMKYASYVDEGHRMDKHFVPGLYVNDAGVLEYDPGNRNKGIVVGTKTPYVEGLHMSDEAKREYERVAEAELKKIGEMLR